MKSFKENPYVFCNRSLIEEDILYGVDNFFVTAGFGELLMKKKKNNKNETSVCIGSIVGEVY